MENRLTIIVLDKDDNKTYKILFVHHLVLVEITSFRILYIDHIYILVSFYLLFPPDICITTLATAECRTII